MKAVVLKDIGQVECVDVAEPQIKKPDDIKIRVDYTVIDETEKLFFTKEVYHGRGVPYIMGSEMSGTITEVGPKAITKGLQVGDKVTGTNVQYCGNCRYCITGRRHACLNLNFNGSTMSEYVVWSEQQVYKLDPSVSQEAACFTNTLAHSIQSLETSQFNCGNSVIIFGSGSLGMTLLLLCKNAGASLVILADSNPAGCAKALELGADHVINTNQSNVIEEVAHFTKSRGVDIAFETSGNQEMVRPAFNSVGRSGHLVISSVYAIDHEFSVNLLQLLLNNVSIHSSHLAPNEIPRALDLIPQIHPERLITGVFHLCQAQKTFQEYMTGQHLKILLKC